MLASQPYCPRYFDPSCSTGADNLRSFMGIAGLGSLGATTGNVAVAAGSIGAQAATPTIAAGIGLAIPIVGAAIAGVTLAISLFLNRAGPKQKVAATHIVDQEEVLLKQNLAAWQGSSKTVAEQQQSLANFNAIWGETTQKLNDPSLGEPGQRGIKDRSRGGKWDWFNYYYDPIANDPNVGKTTASVSEIVSNLTSGGFNPLLLVGGLILFAGLSMLGGSGKIS